VISTYRKTQWVVCELVLQDACGFPVVVWVGLDLNPALWKRAATLFCGGRGGMGGGQEFWGDVEDGADGFGFAAVDARDVSAF
jgi:hypothetical protein